MKVSFRSKGRHNVGSLAATLGGGGRGTASGVLLPMDLSEAIDCVLPRLYNMLGHEAGLLQSGPEILVGAGTDWGSGPARDHPGAFSIALGGISHQDPVFGREEVLPPDLALG